MNVMFYSANFTQIITLIFVLLIFIAAFLVYNKKISFARLIKKLTHTKEYIVIVGLSKIGLRLALDSKEQAKNVVVLSESGENTLSDQLKLIST